MSKSFEWTHEGRENLKLQLEINENNAITSCQMEAIGCLEFLKLSQIMKKRLDGPISQLNPPTGKDHSSMIWREVVYRIKEEWHLPVKHEELCHCRKVTTQEVDRAIVYGAHNIEDIRQRTSANTGCGTCKEDVSSMISNRLKSS